MEREIIESKRKGEREREEREREKGERGRGEREWERERGGTEPRVMEEQMKVIKSKRRK